ncbi:hypothetical protein [Rhodococcus jostii]|nr:hypothetical protein [Rhodococcus jostii]
MRRKGSGVVVYCALLIMGRTYNPDGRITTTPLLDQESKCAPM